MVYCTVKPGPHLGVSVRGVDPEDLHAQVLGLQYGGVVQQLLEPRGEEVAADLHVDGGRGRQPGRPSVLRQHPHLHKWGQGKCHDRKDRHGGLVVKASAS